MCIRDRGGKAEETVTEVTVDDRRGSNDKDVSTLERGVVIRLHIRERIYLNGGQRNASWRSSTQQKALGGKNFANPMSEHTVQLLQYNIIRNDESENGL